MKKCGLVLALAFSIGYAHAQTLITYGSHTVGKDEFLRAYNKNKTPVDDKEKSIRDYVSLYTNFKLKVKAAESMRLDTSWQLQTDMDNFRRQIEDNYMNDDKAVASLMDEAFKRSQEDLHVIHFSVPADATTSDTMQAMKMINAGYDALRSGSEDYATVAAGNGLRWADLGFMTAFSLPYTYENIIYNLKPGETSKPYRSKKAWHLFKVTEKRQSAGKWRIAQILLSFPENADDQTKARIIQKADSVYKLLQSGTDFGSAARLFSEDKLTYLTGGEMPEFGSGKFDYSFEKEVFRLQQDGDISKPFTTGFGVHILKRLGHTPTPTDKEDVSLQYELKQKLMQDERVRTAKDKFAKEVSAKIGMKPVPSVKQADLFRFADTVINDPMGESANTLPISNKPVLNFAKGNAKGSEWLNFVRDYKTNPEMYKGESYAELWEKFTGVAALDYYRKHLADYNTEFRYQLQEFKEGNMLFEVMEKKVWSKAAADSTGLQKHYQANKEAYKWASSADVLIVNAISEQTARQAIDSLKAGWDWRKLVEMKQGELQGDSGRFELTQINGTENTVPGTFSTVNKNTDGTYTFLKYYKHYAAGDQRSFEDSRGMVINDYQQVLEQQWLGELRKKYPVKVNEAVLKTLIR